VGLIPALTPVKTALPAVTDWSRLDLGCAADGSKLVDLARQAATRLMDGPGDDGAKLVAGFSWALANLGDWSEHLLAELAAALDPAYEMAEIVRSRARDGAVYHRNFMIGDRPLSDWLLTGGDDPGDLLRALAASRLVKPGRPEASPLLQGLVSERGPMFRVFSNEELAVMSRWIGALGKQHDGCAAADLMKSASTRTAEPKPGSVPEARFSPPPRPTSLRDAYHLLVHRESSTELSDFADRYVRGWLARAAYRMESTDYLPPAKWRPHVLRRWLHEQHERHDHEFEEGRESALPSREDLLESTVQLAPLTLIDGGWLQGFTAYTHASSEVGHFLYETYWDELGNGQIPLNHPVIFREVLADMGVTLPPTGSVEFSQWTGFREESFRLPLYWLCLGRFPSTYQAETLGMNLAMELSGVGGSYRRARLALKEYGFSTRFVDIHNTIDNVATGHSAWAADAIDAYMCGVASMAGSGALQSHWDRVRTGYRSLNPPHTRSAQRAGRLATRR
jgi:hypothetical protein